MQSMCIAVLVIFLACKNCYSTWYKHPELSVCWAMRKPTWICLRWLQANCECLKCPTSFLPKANISEMLLCANIPSLMTNCNEWAIQGIWLREQSFTARTILNPLSVTIALIRSCSIFQCEKSNSTFHLLMTMCDIQVHASQQALNDCEISWHWRSE